MSWKTKIVHAFRLEANDKLLQLVSRQRAELLPGSRSTELVLCQAAYQQIKVVSQVAKI